MDDSPRGENRKLPPNQEERWELSAFGDACELAVAQERKVWRR